MKDIWYGDKRDIVKWAAVIHLARTESINHVIYVAFLRKTQEMPKMLRDRKQFPIDAEVWNHFRDVQHIHGLEQQLPRIRIHLIREAWDGNDRDAYINNVQEEVRGLGISKKIWLLDPDTGIALTPKTPKPGLVTKQNIRELWEKGLSSQDWMVLYQHKHRYGNAWENKTRDIFEQACGKARVYIFRAKYEKKAATPLANDVALFAAQRQQGIRCGQSANQPNCPSGPWGNR